MNHGVHGMDPVELIDTDDEPTGRYLDDDDDHEEDDDLVIREEGEAADGFPVGGADEEGKP
jgi:hypothetical protein